MTDHYSILGWRDRAMVAAFSGVLEKDPRLREMLAAIRRDNPPLVILEEEDIADL